MPACVPSERLMRNIGSSVLTKRLCLLSPRADSHKMRYRSLAALDDQYQYHQWCNHDQWTIQSFWLTLEASDQLKPEGMITAKVTMDEVVEKRFRTLLEDRGEYCKILVDVQAS
ncbi:hypothetical protein V6Z96_005950 [Aspergillus fumigatus]